MAGRKRSWTTLLRPRAKTYTVRVWLPDEKRTVEVSTGERDPERAQTRGAQIAADLLARKAAPPAPRGSTCDRLTLADAGAKWLLASRGRLGKRTLGAYAEVVQTHLAPVFPSLLDVTFESMRGYIDSRLTRVQVQTVRHELSVLRMLIDWATEQHLIANPPRVPSIPKRALGTPFAKRRRVKADEYSPEEIAAFLDALPDKSTEGVFWVRPRMEFQYETGVRSSTVEKLSVPDHWRPGERQLRLAKMVLKNRKEYVLPISDRAVEILSRVAPVEGIIFGRHDFSEYVAAAAELAMPKGKAERFAQTHLRSAFGSHMLDEGAPLPAVQYAMGHARPSTTDRYARARQHLAEEVLQKLGRRA